MQSKIHHLSCFQVTNNLYEAHQKTFSIISIIQRYLTCSHLLPSDLRSFSCERLWHNKSCRRRGRATRPAEVITRSRVRAVFAVIVQTPPAVPLLKWRAPTSFLHPLQGKITPNNRRIQTGLSLLWHSPSSRFSFAFKVLLEVCICSCTALLVLDIWGSEWRL